MDLHFSRVLTVIGALCAGVCLAALTACDNASADAAPAPREPGPPRIVVTIAPVAGLVRELVGDNAEVTTLLPAGASPHGFELTPDNVRTLARADLIVAVGAGMEPWLERRMRSAPQLATKAVAFADLVGVVAEPCTAHHHGHDHEGHAHAGPDPHLWLDPMLASEFVTRLAPQLPLGLAEPAESAARDVAARIAELDAAYTTRLEPFKGHAIVTHHAAFGRPAERYGLVVAEVLRPVHTAEPSPGELARATSALKDRGARAMFIEPQFNSAAAERIAAASGVRLGKLDPLGTGDWFAMMESNLDELVRVLGDTP